MEACNTSASFTAMHYSTFTLGFEIYIETCITRTRTIEGLSMCSTKNELH